MHFQLNGHLVDMPLNECPLDVYVGIDSRVLRVLSKCNRHLVAVPLNEHPWNEYVGIDLRCSHVDARIHMHTVQSYYVKMPVEHILRYSPSAHVFKVPTYPRCTLDRFKGLTCIAKHILRYSPSTHMNLRYPPSTPCIQEHTKLV